MNNRRGQALIEFILILPVFLIILFTIVDFGRYWYTKNHLENVSTDVILLLKNGKNIEEVSIEYSDIEIEKNMSGEDYYGIQFIQEIELITPFLDKILGNPCEVMVERKIPRDE